MDPVHIPGVGEPAPWFKAAALSGNPNYVFDTVAGHAVLMLFFRSASEANVQAALNGIAGHRDLFDDHRACFYGVTTDQDDAEKLRIAQSLPGIRYFLDYDHGISTLFGAARRNDEASEYRPHWVVLDRQLRICGRFELPNFEAAIAQLKTVIAAENPDAWAPVLEIPNVFDREICARLVALYEQEGGSPSGFMREVDGKTMRINDHQHKKRSDLVIEDQALCRLLQSRVFYRVKPMIERAFQYEITRMERYIVACYDAEAGDHFNRHRDNTTSGTAHRRFACTINLNAEDYEGGNLCFPEFGSRSYRAPTGGAIIFSCSLLHEAQPVTRGRRYAFLPFFYDDAAAAIRLANNPNLGHNVGQYSIGQ